MPAVLNLNKYRELFKDDASFKKFAVALASACREDMSFVLYDESFLVVLISVEEAEENLKMRILRRLSGTNP